MSRGADRVARFVDAILRDRRPRRFPADPDEADAIQAAAALRGARPGVDLPSPEFVDALGRRLGRESESPRRSGGPQLTRRRLIEAAGVTAAAAVVAGVAVDRLAPAAGPGSGDGTADTGAGAPGQDSLDLSNGRWVPVAAVAAIGPSQAVRFSASAVEGFVVNKGGQFDAVSAVCTHMGCILHFNQTAGRLDCPCHGASFDLEGSPINREYLKSLTKLQSRVRDGMVEVQVNQA